MGERHSGFYLEMMLYIYINLCVTLSVCDIILDNELVLLLYALLNLKMYNVKGGLLLLFS